MSSNSTIYRGKQTVLSRDDLIDALSTQFDELGDLFLESGACSTDDFNYERDEFINWGIALVNQCMKGMDDDEE